MEVMASMLELFLPNYAYRQRPGAPPPAAPDPLPPKRRGNQQSAAIGLYPCADGYIGVHAMPRQMPALLAMVGIDDRALLGEDRLRRNDELTARIYAWAADLSRREAYRIAGEHQAPLAFVHDLRDLLDSEHLRARRFFREVDHPEAGALMYPRGPFVMGDAALRQAQDGAWLEGRAPLLGEHNEEVYCGLLGLRRGDLATLRGAGVI
jgi:crotonobetainyl-CoA:carnitine CoA-transferase CaiB-like acyl-CoA transferase